MTSEEERPDPVAVTIVTVDRVLERGVSQPLLARDVRGQAWVMKTGNRVLPDHLAELAAAVLAPIARVRVPRCGVASVDEPLIRSLEALPETLAHAQRLRSAGGTAFVSGWLNRAVEYDVQEIAVPDSLALERIAWFDAWIGNADRTAANPNLLWVDDEIVAIDHAAAFPWLTSPETPSNHPPTGGSPLGARRRAAPAILPSEDEIYARLAPVPSTWWGEEVTPERLSGILAARARLIAAEVDR